MPKPFTASDSVPSQRRSPYFLQRLGNFDLLKQSGFQPWEGLSEPQKIIANKNRSTDRKSCTESEHRKRILRHPICRRRRRKRIRRSSRNATQRQYDVGVL